jgi:MarR family transcriptional regulator for hemolysin
MSRIDLERAFAQRLIPLSRRWQQLADRAVAGLGVSHATGWCLVYLGRLGPDARQADLAQAIGIRQPSLVRTLDRLEQAALVRRVPHPEDRRSNRLELTGKGRELVGRIEACLAEIRHSLLTDVATADIATALALFALIDERAVTLGLR